MLLDSDTEDSKQSVKMKKICRQKLINGKCWHRQKLRSLLNSANNMGFLAVIFTLLCSLHIVTAFNVDVGSRVVHTAPRDSCDNTCMFGFSVAEHKEQGQPW